MNQKKSFIGERAVTQCPQGVCRMVFIVTVVHLMPTPLWAQSPWESPNAPAAHQSNSEFSAQTSSDWQHPSNQVAPQDANPNSSWPQQPTSFDGPIQPARFEEVVSQSIPGATTTGKLESLIDSAGPTIDGLKKQFQAKASGLLAFFRGGDSSKSINVPRMLSSLAIVIGIYLILVWIMQRVSPRTMTSVPTDVLQVLGRVPFDGRQSLQLVRLGSKLVLLLNGPEGTHPIGEITDPQEVQELTARCGGKKISFTRHSTSNTHPGVGIGIPRMEVEMETVESRSVQDSLKKLLKSLGQSGSTASQRTIYDV